MGISYPLDSWCTEINICYTQEVPREGLLEANMILIQVWVRYCYVQIISSMHPGNLFLSSCSQPGIHMDLFSCNPVSPCIYMLGMSTVTNNNSKVLMVGITMVSVLLQWLHLCCPHSTAPVSACGFSVSVRPPGWLPRSGIHRSVLWMHLLWPAWDKLR